MGAWLHVLESCPWGYCDFADCCWQFSAISVLALSAAFPTCGMTVLVLLATTTALTHLLNGTFGYLLSTYIDLYKSWNSTLAITFGTVKGDWASLQSMPVLTVPDVSSPSIQVSVHQWLCFCV